MQNILLFTSILFLAACTGLPTAATQVPFYTLSIPELESATDCNSLDVAQAYGSDEPSLFPDVSPDEHSYGPGDASVTIIEYADFQCPSCAQLAPILALLALQFPEEVRIIFRHLPLIDIHDKALLAARASEAAAQQFKFWEMHDILYHFQDDWTRLSQQQFTDWLLDQAADLSLNLAEFQNALNNATITDVLEQDLEDALRIGLRATPFLLLNGQIQEPPYNYYFLEQTVRLVLLSDRQFTTCPPQVINPLKEYSATLHTEKGDITIQLYPDKAPIAVNSFVFLAQNGWYDEITFHRVVPGSVAQTGDPSATGFGHAGYYFPDEIDADLRFDKSGVVAMWNLAPDTNGSQFFITYAPLPNLDGLYTIFGQVISGMEVLSQLTARDPLPGVLLDPGDQLYGITIEQE